MASRIESLSRKRRGLGYLENYIRLSIELAGEKSHHLPIHVRTWPEIHQARDLLLDQCFRPSGKQGSCEEPSCDCRGVCMC